ncbi:MAG: ABZJ_00895 family protein [Pseudomonadota bacterium]
MSLTSKTLLNFATYYVAAVIGVIILFAILESVAQIEAPSSIGLITFMAAVMGAGTKLGEQLSEIPSSGILWGLAFKMTLLSIFISLALAGVFLAFLQYADPAQVKEIFGLFRGDFGFVGMIMLALLLVYLLMARLFLRMGIKAGMKKRAA